MIFSVCPDLLGNPIILTWEDTDSDEIKIHHIYWSRWSRKHRNPRRCCISAWNINSTLKGLNFEYQQLWVEDMFSFPEWWTDHQLLTCNTLSTNHTNQVFFYFILLHIDLPKSKNMVRKFFYFNLFFLSKNMAVVADPGFVLGGQNMSSIAAGRMSHFNGRINWLNWSYNEEKVVFYGVAAVILKSPGCAMKLDNEAAESWKSSNTNSVNTMAPFCALARADGFLWAEIVHVRSCLCIKRCCLILCLSQVSARHQQTRWVMSSTNGLLWRLCRRLPGVATDNSFLPDVSFINRLL